MDNELYHFKYTKREKTSNGKWRYWYEDEDEQFASPGNTAYDKREASKNQRAAEQAKQAKKREETEIERKRTIRYVEAAKIWLDTRLGVKVADVVKGKARVATWEESKQMVDAGYARGDKRLFISKYYKEG